jgi:GNAT superfamily N-acetyltransferase
MYPPDVQVAGANERQSVLNTLTLAFTEDPPMRWFFPHADEFLTYFTRFAMGMGGRAFDHGTAFYLADYSAAALWLPPNVTSDTEALLEIFGSLAWPPAKSADLGAMAEQIGAYHPHDPHWYLAFIGADAAYQGKGLGSILMKHALALCDRDRLPAYLESSTPKNVPFYERFGFEAIGRVQAGSSPVITPMLRAPR